MLIFVGINTITAQQEKPYQCPTPLNLVSNGNFMYGNDGSFQSGLAFSCNSCNAGSYCIGNQLSSKCNAWAANTFDHTLGNASGSYMIVDGNATKPSIVWSDTVCVCNGVDYTFSFWVKSIYPASKQNFDLGLMIDGVNQKTVTIAQSTPSWTKYEVTWTSNKNGCIPIAIQQLTGGAFRDFGLDDIAFDYCCDCNAATNIEDDCAVDIDTTIVTVSCGNLVDIKSVFDGTPSAIKYIIYDSTGVVVFTTSNTSQFLFTLPSAGIFYGVVEISCGGGTTKGGDEDEDVFEIINLAPVADFRLNSAFSCISGNPTRTVNTLDYSNEEGTLSYLYKVTDIKSLVTTTYTTAQPTFIVDSKKAYDVELTVTDAKGCTNQKTMRLDSVVSCEAKFKWWYSWCPDSCKGLSNITVNFENNSVFANCSATPVYTWDYGDGQTATGNNPQHIYTNVPCGGKSFPVSLTMTLGNIGDKDYCKSVWTAVITLDSTKVKVVVDKICCDGLVFFSTNAKKGQWNTPGSLGIPKWPAVSKKIWQPTSYITLGKHYRQYYSTPGTYYIIVNGAESENHNRCQAREIPFTIKSIECFNRNVRAKNTDVVGGVNVKYKFTALALPLVHRMKSKIRAKGGKKVAEISTDFAGTINKKGADGCFCTPQPVGQSSSLLYDRRKAAAVESSIGRFRIGMNKATANYYIKTKGGVTKTWTLSLGRPPCDHPWFLFF